MVKKKALFSSSDDCCVFRNSFPFVHWCRLPVRCCSALHCGSAWQVYMAQIAIKNHYGKMLRLKLKQHCCKLHLGLEVKLSFFVLFFFLCFSGSYIIRNYTNPFRSGTMQIHYSWIMSPVSSGQPYFLLWGCTCATGSISGRQWVCKFKDNDFLQIALQEKYR